MPMLQGIDTVSHWLSTIGVKGLIVVSPHLDDAVLSIAGLLRAAGGQAQVLTVFTESDAHVGMEWAQAAGFSDAREEHTERRLEDIRAMHYLGCAPLHGGLRSGELTNEAAESLIHGLLETDASSGSEALVLLPAACGGTRPYTWFQRLRNRVLRRPFGAPAHPEHKEVRDQLWSVISRRSMRVGFYADLPYAWRQSDASIQADLEACIGQVLEVVHLKVDLPDKLAAVEHYHSQMRLILGDKPAYRQRVLSRPECVFLVKTPFMSGMP